MRSYSQLLESVRPEDWDSVNAGVPITVECPDCHHRHSVILLKHDYERELAKPEGEQNFIACPCTCLYRTEQQLLGGGVVSVVRAGG